MAYLRGSAAPHADHGPTIPWGPTPSATRAWAARAVKARVAKALVGHQASRTTGLRGRARTWGLGSATGSGGRGRRHAALAGRLVQTPNSEGFPVRSTREAIHVQGSAPQGMEGDREILRLLTRRWVHPDSGGGFTLPRPLASYRDHLGGGDPGGVHAEESLRSVGPRPWRGRDLDLPGLCPLWAGPALPGMAPQAPSLARQHLRKPSASHFSPLPVLPQPWRAAAGPCRPR